MAGLMREVHIRPVLNGFVVSVGCQTLVFSSIKEVADGLIEYHKDPRAMTQKLQESSVNPTLGYPTDIPAPVEAGYALNRNTVSSNGLVR